MLLRKVEIDFSDAKIHGNPRAPEYSHILNGVSVLLPDLEAFLNRTVRQGAKQLSADAHDLRQDVNLFTWQEGRHARMHGKFNKLLQSESGYEFLDGMLAKMYEDYQRFEKEKGPQFCLAYAEGFETFGTWVSYFFFERSGTLMADWDEPTIYLWMWHIAEEYEHRTVCNHLYRAVYDDGFWTRAYWTRMYGLWYATTHLFGFVLRAALKFIDADRKQGRIKHPIRSRLRFARDAARFFGYVIPHMIFFGMRPGWDPIHVPPPRRSMELLAEASERYGIREPV